SSHTSRPSERSIENRVNVEGRSNGRTAPRRRFRWKKPVFSSAFAVQLADVLRFGTAKLLNGQFGILPKSMPVRFALLSRRSCCSCRFAEAVLANSLLDSVNQRGRE